MATNKKIEIEKHHKTSNKKHKTQNNTQHTTHIHHNERREKRVRF
jgi:hypothetical protein